MHVLVFWGAFVVLMLPIWKCVAIQEALIRRLGAPDPAPYPETDSASASVGGRAEAGCSNDQRLGR